MRFKKHGAVIGLVVGWSLPLIAALIAELFVPPRLGPGRYFPLASLQGFLVALPSGFCPGLAGWFFGWLWQYSETPPPPPDAR